MTEPPSPPAPPLPTAPTTPAPPLPEAPSPETPRPLDARRAALARLTDETFDVVIVGGGIVGCGALLDAASRGLRAALVEQEEFI